MEKESEVYNYSKQFSSVDRYKKAKKIRQTRAEYFSRQPQLNKEIDQVTERKRLIEESLIKIEGLKEWQRQLEAKFIGKLVHFLTLRKIRSEIQNQSSQISDEDLAQARTNLDNLEAARNDRHEIDEAKKILAEFWGGQTKEFEEAEEISQVEAVSRRYNCHFIHGFRKYTPDENSLLKPGLTWKEKFEVFLAFGGTVSASTISGNRQGIFSDVGVVINGGRVLDAFKSDTGTVAFDLKRRGRSHSTEKKITDQIAKSVEPMPGFGEAAGAYNEFVIEDGQIAAMYFSTDKQQGAAGATLGEVFQTAEEYGLPVYQLIGGRLFAMGENGAWDYDHEVDRETILESRVDLSERAAQLRQKFIEETPFRQEVA